MDIERSFIAQQNLGDIYGPPIKRLKDRIAGRIYNDENELGKIRESLDKLQGNQNQCLKDAEQMKEFDSVFGVVRAGSGLRKGRNNFPLDWALLDIKGGQIGEIPNQVRRSLRYLFQLSTWRDFLNLFNITLPTSMRSPSKFRGYRILAKLRGRAQNILNTAKFPPIAKKETL